MLLGPTGAGKSVQAAILAEKYQIVDGNKKICVCVLVLCSVCVLYALCIICSVPVCACFSVPFLLPTQWTLTNWFSRRWPLTAD